MSVVDGHGSRVWSSVSDAGVSSKVAIGARERYCTVGVPISHGYGGRP